jgi:hypothetical protein
MMSLIFLILRLLNVINTPYDWLILALLYVGDGAWIDHKIQTSRKDD